MNRYFINRKLTVPRSEWEVLLRYVIELVQLFYHTHFQICVIISPKLKSKTFRLYNIVWDLLRSFSKTSLKILTQWDYANMKTIGFRKPCFPRAHIYNITICLAHPVESIDLKFAEVAPHFRSTVFLATRKSRMKKLLAFDE